MLLLADNHCSCKCNHWPTSTAATTYSLPCGEIVSSVFEDDDTSYLKDVIRMLKSSSTAKTFMHMKGIE